MTDSGSGPPYGLLFMGIFFLFLGVAAALTGEGVARFGRMVERSKNPRHFRLLIAVELVGGAFLIGFFLYKVYLTPH